MRSLRVQLLLSHMLLIVVLTSIVSTLFLAQFDANRDYNAALSQSYAESKQLDALRQITDRHQTAVARYLAGDGVGSKIEIEQARVSLERLGQNQSLRDSDAFLACSKFSDEAAALVLSRENPTREEAFQRFIKRIQPAESRSRTQILLAQTHIQQFLRETGEAIRERSNVAANKTILIISALTLAVAVGVVFLVRKMLQPLKALADHAQKVGAGDLSSRLKRTRNDEIGRLTQSLNLMTDRLAETKAVENQQLLRATQMSSSALQFLYDPVIVTDSQGNIVLLNRAAEGLFGPSPDSPRPPIINQPSDRQIVRAIQRALEKQTLTEEEVDSNLVHIQHGGTARQYRMRTTSMQEADGTILGCVCVLEDITHLKEVEQLKQEFIGVASHELRTPVASLLLGTQLLEQGAIGPLNESQTEVVRTLREDLERLHRMMQELLDLNRLEAGSGTRFKLVEAGELLRQCERSVRARAGDKGIQINLEVPESSLLVQADPSQITRVLVNLSENGIRHTHQGGTLTLRAFPVQNGVTFSVGDTGEGIPPEYLKRIFERFVQVPGATQGGAGLGLAIAQTILRAHQSNLTVTSEIGVGSTFSFTLKQAGAEVDSSPTSNS